MNLIEFYKKVLQMLGLTVTEEGYIKIKIGTAETMVTVDGKPLVLPTKENVKTVFKPDENGNLVTTKVLFNPLKEDVIKGESLSLKKLKSIIEIRVTMLIAGIGEMLCEIGADTDLQKKASMNINEFLVELNKATTGKVKTVVDEKTIRLWKQLFKKALEAPANKGFFHLFLKKGGKIGEMKYNRIAVATFPVYEELKELKKDKPIFGLNLRNKDIGVFKEIFHFLFGEEEWKVGSTDNMAPGFVAMFRLYYKVLNRFNPIIKDLEIVKKDVAEELYTDMILDEDMILNVGAFKTEVDMLPSDGDKLRIERKIQAEQNPAEVEIDPMDVIRGRMDTKQVQQYPQPTTQYPQVSTKQDDSPPWDDNDDNPLNIIYGNQQPQPQQYNLYQMQQQMPQQPQRKIGINVPPSPALYQQQYPQPQVQQVGYPQQPMYGQQQPMYPQPQMQQGYGQPQQMPGGPKLDKYGRIIM